MSDWKVLPAEAKLPPLADVKLNLIYQAAEETCRFAKTSWFFIAFTFVLAFAGVALAADGDILELYSREQRLEFFLIPCAIVLAFTAIAIAFVGLTHLAAAALRQRLREADVLVHTNPQGDVFYKKLFDKSQSLSRTVQKCRIALTISVGILFVGLAVATVLACALAFQELT